MPVESRAEQIADKYLPKIRFTCAYFYENDTSPFPACLHLEIPAAMLREYTSLRKVKGIPKGHDEEREFLTDFWKETGLAKKLMAHEDVNKVPERSRESPMDMLEYLAGENVYVLFSPVHKKRDLRAEKVEIEVQDMPPQDEDEGA